MKTLITGSGGFIGRTIARTIAKEDDVTGIELSAGEDAIDFFRYDGTRFDRVYHCAALVGGRQTIDGNPMAVAGNLAIDSLAFEWALRTRPEQFVYFSSSAAYPIDLQQRHSAVVSLSEWMIDLANPREPDQTYGLTKLVGEVLVERARAEGLRVYVFRPFSGYGPGQSLDYPFPSFIDRVRQGSDPFEVWGDGTQSRDFIHVDDIMAAVRRALAVDYQGPVNLCTGIRTTFALLARTCLQRAGHAAHVQTHPERPTGVWRRVGDPTQMHDLYVPRISLEDGIDQALAAIH